MKPESQSATVNIPEEEAIKNIPINVRALLDKVTANNINELTEEFISYNIFSKKEQLTEVIRIFFDQGANKSKRCSLYTDILKDKLKSIQKDTEISAFTKAIQCHLKTVFCSSKPAEARRYSVFMGHLFIRLLISLEALDKCCRRLLESISRKQDEDSLLCGLELFKIIGPCIDRTREKTEAVEFLNGWFQKLKDAKPLCTDRSRCLITSLVDLRKNSWRLIPEQAKTPKAPIPEVKTQSKPNKRNRRRAKLETTKEQSPIRVGHQRICDLLDNVSQTTVKKITKEFISLNVCSNQQELENLIKIFFDKAINKPEHGSQYSDILKDTLGLIQNDMESALFRKAMQSQLTTIFCNSHPSEARKNSVFLGHLYIRRLVTNGTLQKCCFRLFESISKCREGKIDEESVLSGLELLKIIGPFIDKVATEAKEFLDDWLQKLETANVYCESQTRCLITNLLELRANKWRIKEEKRSTEATSKEQVTRKDLCQKSHCSQDKLTEELISYNIFSDKELLKELIRIIFDKALTESKQSSYADMLEDAFAHRIDTERSMFTEAIQFNLKIIFCNSKAREARRHSVFMGHLYTRRLVMQATLETCCRRLLGSVLQDRGEIDEESVICALEMFEIIGPFIDKVATEAKELLDDWLQKLEISKESCTKQTRCLITNILELRANKWSITPEVKEQNSSKTPWEPEDLGSTEQISAEEASLKDLSEKTRDLLDKVTPTNIDQITQKLISYYSTSHGDELNEVIVIIFQNAANDPIHCALYAEICKLYVEKKATAFLRALHTRIGFLLQNYWDIRKYSLFIGHLYRSQVIQFQTLKPFFLILFESIPSRKITTKIGIAFMRDRIDEGGIRIGIELFEIVGYRLTNEFLEEWFQKLENLQSFCSNDLRFLIMDLMELRENGWVGRSEIQKKTEENRRREEKKIPSPTTPKITEEN